MPQGLLASEQDDIRQQIAETEAQIQNIQRGGLMQAGFAPGGGGNTYSKSSLPNQDIQGVYGLLAQYGDNPAAVGQQYVQAMQNQGTLAQAGRAPSNVREWQHYQSLTPEEQKAYLEMKRGIQTESIAGELYRMFGGTDASGGTGPGGGIPGIGDRLSSLEEEAAAAERLKAAEGRGGRIATRFDILETSRPARYENYSQAQRLRNLIEQDKLATGQYQQFVYKVLPTAEQESLDALAEFAARERLKLSGEIRPTDADVVGAKRALFGSDRTEEFSVESLDRLLREIQSQEDEYSRLSSYYSSGTDLGAGPAPYVPGGGPTTPGGPGVNPNQGQRTEEPDYSNMSVDEMLQMQRRTQSGTR